MGKVDSSRKLGTGENRKQQGLSCEASLLGVSVFSFLNRDSDLCIQKSGHELTKECEIKA